MLSPQGKKKRISLMSHTEQKRFEDEIQQAVTRKVAKVRRQCVSRLGLFVKSSPKLPFRGAREDSFPLDSHPTRTAPTPH